MNEIRNPKFFSAGRAVFTVANNKGDHYTFRIGRRNDTQPLFVGLLTGPDNTSSYTYLGILSHAANPWSSKNPANRNLTIDAGHSLWLTPKSKYTPETVPVKVVTWIIKTLNAGKPLPAGYAVQHNGKCCCCGRTLTTPESIDAGIGPICAEKHGW